MKNNVAASNTLITVLSQKNISFGKFLEQDLENGCTKESVFPFSPAFLPLDVYLETLAVQR